MNKPLPIPVTILTGFLGSGKTTLINHLLSHYPDEKIAIVENEFGAVGIDGSLLSQNSGVEIIELTNGCVCCSVRGELTAALHELLNKYQTDDLHFNQLILETTGLADPAPIIQTFFVDETLRTAFMLDGVVTLVDCLHAQQQLTEHRVAVSQVGFADRLILTKADLIDDDMLDQLLVRISQINAKALICRADNGKLDKKAWIGLQAFYLNDVSPVNPEDLHSISSVVPLSSTTSSAVIAPQELSIQSWNDDISSHVFRAHEMNIKKIGAFMEQAIECYGNDMLRYKGIIAIANHPQRLIVQGVHKVVGFDYGNEWQPDEEKNTTLVIIGRNLPIELLREQFELAKIDSLS